MPVTILRTGRYRSLAAALFLSALTFYLLTLPAAYTGGAVGFVSLRYLNPELAFFSVTLALLLSLALTLNVYGFRASLRRRGAGASTPQIFGLSGRIQGTVARHEPVFLSGAVLLLLLSVRFAAQNVTGACALPVKGGHIDAPERSTQV